MNRGMLDRFRGSVGLSQSNLRNENVRSNDMPMNYGNYGNGPRNFGQQSYPQQQQPSPQPMDYSGGNKPMAMDSQTGGNGPQPGAAPQAGTFNGPSAGPVLPQFNGGRPNGQPNQANQWRPTPGRFDWRTMRNPLTPEQGAWNATAEMGWGQVGNYNFGGNGQQQPPKPSPGYLGPPLPIGGGTDPYIKDPYTKG